MARLIDADELKSKLQGHKDFFVDGWGGFDKMSFATKCRVDEIDNCIAEIVNAPNIDAVPVVRCKDCKKWDRSIGSCEEFTSHRFPAGGRIAFLTREDDFCSYGEARE